MVCITRHKLLQFNGCKRLLKTFFAFLLLIFSIQAISNAQNSKHTDFVVLNSADTLYGLVEHIHSKSVSPRFYKKIRLTDHSKKRRQFKRKDVLAFQAEGAIYQSFWLSQSSEKIKLLNPRYEIDSKNGEQHFLKLISKGKLSHYHLEWWEQGESALLSMDLLKKEKSPFFIRATQGVFGLKFKVLADYFADCPELNAQMKQKQFKQVGEIVDFYNSNCLF